MQTYFSNTRHLLPFSRSLLALIICTQIIKSHTTVAVAEIKHPPTYPAVRRNESVIDDYHGTKVVDPYRWLEEADSIETKKFVQEQKLLTKEYLENISVRESIREELTQLVNYPKYSAPIKKRNRYFHFENTGLQDHDVLMIQDSLEGPNRVLVDPNTYSEDGSISLGYYNAYSENAEVFVYTLSQSGSDWLTTKFKNVTSGEYLADTLESLKWPDFSWTHDNLGLFYSRFPLGDDGTPISENPQIYYHRLGEHHSNDTFITENAENPQWFLMAQVTDDGKYLLVKPQPDFKANGVIISPLDGYSLPFQFEFYSLFSADLNVRFIYVTNQEKRFVFLSDYNAPNFQVISVTIDLNPESKSLAVVNTTVLVPEHHQYILKWVSVFNFDKLILCYFEDVKHKLEVRNISNGALLQEIPLEPGIISGYSIFKENNEFFFKFENLLTPGRIFRCFYNSEGGESEQFKCEIFHEVQLTTDIDLSNFVMNQVFYSSEDGTKIPMYIAHKKDLQWNGKAPTLMFGYGGFNVDLLPSFSPFNLEFMDYFNGVYACPNIRGGAEYGEKWHEDGMLLNKQNSFNDFQAAAEYLIENNYTSSPNLTIQGSSNGGLLVAACVNQRPDLFGIALPDVALTDMLRFHKFTIGYAWCSEYGCSDDETHFQNLFSYSPLHNIRIQKNDNFNPVTYPAVLVSTADHDDRVVPSHSFKYVAELQHTIGNDPNQKKTFILRVETDAGHNGDGKPTIKQIADYTDFFAFIAENLQQDTTDNTNGAISLITSHLSVLTVLISSLILNF